TTVEALLEGVQMVERKLLRALESAGLELVEARGERFDPEVHEALMTAATEHEHEDDTVGEVFQKGYRFQGQLLRPARVQVRKHPGCRELRSAAAVWPRSPTCDSERVWRPRRRISTRFSGWQRTPAPMRSRRRIGSW